MAWGEWKQRVLLEWYIMLIAVLGAAYADSRNIEITLYCDNCGGQGNNKLKLAIYLHVVMNLLVHFVTYKYIAVVHTQNEVDISHSLMGKNTKMSLKSGTAFSPHRTL